MTHIGIDTGTHTGFAAWDGRGKQFLAIETLPLHAALLRVHTLAKEQPVEVWYEDARQRKWYGNNTAAKDRARLQGAGSVKRDSTIWEEALTDWGIPFHKIPPCANMTKLSAERFRNLTGWTGRTNEHSRDAAMLVWGR